MMSKYQKTGVPVGRPLKEIKQQTFESLCLIQCTQEEICAVLDVDDKTLTAFCKRTYGRSFSDVYAEKRKGGKASLRRMQWKSAEGGNPTMQIWLGKQYLGQAEPQRNDTVNVNHGGHVDTILQGLTMEQLLKLAGESDGTEAEG